MVCFLVQMVDTEALIRPWALRSCHRVIALSEFHKAALAPHIVTSPKATSMQYGLEQQRFVDGPNLHNRFVYASSPNRGLEQVWLSHQ